MRRFIGYATETTSATNPVPQGSTERLPNRYLARLNTLKVVRPGQARSNFRA